MSPPRQSTSKRPTAREEAEGPSRAGPGANRQPSRGLDLGAFPALALSTSIGLYVCSVADALSRSTVLTTPVVLFAGLLIIGLPIFHRLCSIAPSPGERLALVCLLGLAFYAVKVIREPFVFSIPDEFLHAYNADQIAIHHHLYHPNPVLAVSSYFPGLEGATSAVASMTGLSTLAAGTFVVGAARLVLCIALFYIFQRISGSARTAGVGAAIYAGNPNFLVFGAQYSYQSLALPLMVVAIWTLVERDFEPPRTRRAWAIPIVLLIAAVVVTHHVTSYGLAAVLVALTIAYLGVGLGWRSPNPFPFAVLAVALAGAWVLVVASAAVGYLDDIFGSALSATIDTLSGAASPRALFQSSNVGGAPVPPTPTPGRAVAVASVLILFACLPFGLREIRRHYRDNAFALLFGLMAIGFFAALGLRFASDAWETANRSSEFFFIGLAFVAALAVVIAYDRLQAGRSGRRSLAARLLLSSAFGVVVIGGAIAGWPWDAQVAQPIRVEADERSIESEPLALAQWAERNVPNGKFVGRIADSYLLLAPGGQRALGGSPTVDTLLSTPTLESWEKRYLAHRNVRYVVADRKRASADNSRGYFFLRRPLPPRGELLSPRNAARKFVQIRTAGRIFDSGNIVVYDLKARH